MRTISHTVAVLTLSLFAVLCSAAEDAPQCPQGDGYVDCMANAGDKMAIYVKGREAYEAARQSGDYTEALRIARSLDRADDENGERLLKMVDLQLSWGGHKDLVQAYVWLSEDLAAGKNYVAPLQRKLAQKMTPEQLQQAQSQLNR